jgi:hypothetical protein
MAARQIKLTVDHAAIAQRYSYWAWQQIELAGQSPNPKVRHDRLALSEYYFMLAKAELTAVERLEMSAVADPPRGGLPRAA